MDFFKSVFSSEPDPLPSSDDEPEPEPEEEAALLGTSTGGGRDTPSSGEAGAESTGGGGSDGDGGGAPVAARWGGFTGLIKTLASKSETVIQTYRRDLEEFGSGLRKESVAIREAIRDLPTSLETGASVAQESLESVGQAIDDFGGSVWRGTADIIAQGKDAILAMDADASADIGSPLDAPPQGAAAVAPNRYSRFEAKVMAIQSDPATFTEEPEDAEDFRAWMAGFQLAEKETEIESFLAENKALEGNLARLVPNVVDHETFWSRYFYKVYKLKQAEDVRVNLVKRAISKEEEEDLTWEVDDDDVEKDRAEALKEGQEEGEEQRDNQGKGEEAGVSIPKEAIDEKKDSVEEEHLVKNSQFENVAEIASASLSNDVSSEVKEEEHSGDNNIEAALKVDDKMPLEGRGEAVESCKDSDVSIVSSQPSIPEEDDLGWDEIEDLGDTDEKKVAVSAGSPHKIDLRKKLSAAEEDEDLSWDIEDDEPIKP